MPQNNYDPAPPPGDAQLSDSRCPKCGNEMEPIEVGVEGPPLQELQLCPGCYLVTWTDHDGPHIRQGVPVRKDIDLRRDPESLPGEPEQC